jgi:preprotein translocase subunit SecA
VITNFRGAVLMVRKDSDDVVYKNERGKFKAVLDEIADCHERGQPVLVGTISVEKSEILSQLLKKRGIPHEVLKNALPAFPPLRHSDARTARGI